MTTVPAALGLSSDEVADLLGYGRPGPVAAQLPAVAIPGAPAGDRAVGRSGAPPARRRPDRTRAARWRVAPRCSTCGWRCTGAASGHSSPCTPTGTTPIFWPPSATADARPPTPVLRQLLAAVPSRHTNRLPFADEPVTTGERAALRKAAMEEGAWLHMVENDRGAERARPPRRRGAHHPTGRPGIPGRARASGPRWPRTATTAFPPARATTGPPPTNAGSSGTSPAASGRSTATAGTPFEQEPAIAVLTSYAFGPSADVAAGQAMQRVLLTATARG